MIADTCFGIISKILFIIVISGELNEKLLYLYHHRVTKTQYCLFFANKAQHFSSQNIYVKLIFHELSHEYIFISKRFSFIILYRNAMTFF
jgi:hypothetical protein